MPEPAIDLAVLAEHYAALPKFGTFHSRCAMSLVDDLRGKAVLDVDCRRGKGVIKFSDRVGQDGRAAGVDPCREWIDVALANMEDAWQRNGLAHNNMDFRVGYAENLKAAGFGDAEFDVVFENSSINVAYDPAAAFQEFFRVLRPGGILILDTVVAEGERDAQVVCKARKIGNSVQAALSRSTLEEYAKSAGFEAPEYHEESDIDIHAGVEEDTVFEAVDTHEDVAFTKTTALVAKPQ